MTVDYELLLAKYIEHVGAEEGITFISRLEKNADGLFEGRSENVNFSDEEMGALRACEQQFLLPSASAHDQVGRFDRVTPQEDGSFRHSYRGKPVPGPAGGTEEP